MILYVVAHPPAEYEAWLRHAREPAAIPADPVAAEGQRVFLGGPCILCHAIRGTEARARVGPDLTHIGSRLGLAANTLTNDVASMEAWVTHAQSLKPNAQMPNLTVFRGDELRALVAYLRGLQ
jgi:cytochrome c oxidase subunit 2